MERCSIIFWAFALFLILSYCDPTFAAALSAQRNKSEQFLSLADLHFDPFLSCQQKPCPLIQKLQEAQPEQWNEIFSRYDTSATAYGKDSNAALLKSSFTAAKAQTKTAPVQFVLVLGDFLAHRYDTKYFKYANDPTREGYRLFVKKTMAFLASELQQAFPQTDIYWVVGNNDSYQEDYTVEPDGPFFEDLSKLAAPLIKNKNNSMQFLRAFPHGGYYAVDAPQQPALRLIFLNSVLFSTKARGQNVEQTAQAQLAWLHQELNQARQKKQKILLAMHIPTGVDVYTTLFIPFSVIEFWKTPYSQGFLHEIQQASSSIMGVFSGHTHADAFQILVNPPYQPVLFTSTPSISPVFGNNPAFKVYQYAVPDLRLTDFATYYFSLNKQNTWEKEYDFDEVYQLNHNDGVLINGMLRLQPTGQLADRYKAYYAVNSDSQPITKHNKWLPYYWCAIRGLTSTTYRSCLALS